MMPEQMEKKQKERKNDKILFLFLLLSQFSREKNFFFGMCTTHMLVLKM